MNRNSLGTRDQLGGELCICGFWLNLTELDRIWPNLTAFSTQFTNLCFIQYLYKPGCTHLCTRRTTLTDYIYHRRSRRQSSFIRNKPNTLATSQNDSNKKKGNLARLNKILDKPNYPQSLTEMKLELRHFAQLYGGSVRQAYMHPYKFACKEIIKITNGCGTWPFSLEWWNLRNFR